MREFTRRAHRSGGNRVAALAALVVAAAGCSGSDAPSPPATTYWAISGTVSGDVAAGVAVRIAGRSGSVMSDAAGHYRIAVTQAGTYTVAASLDGYLFAPSSRTVTVSSADVGGQDFTATLDTATLSVSGVVTGDSVAGVTVTSTGPLPATTTVTTTTDDAGGYAFHKLADGQYLVTPSHAGGYTFFPANSLVTVDGVNVGGPDFVSTAAPRTISGKVSGAVMAGVTVTLSGAASAVATTDASGAYTFGGLDDGAYTVTPALDGYAFDPAGLPVTIAGADAPDQDFTAAATHTISGTISGAVAFGVTVTLSGAAAGEFVTDGTGYYEFTGLVDGAYVVTPALEDYTFDPVSRSLTLAGVELTGEDFVSAPVPTWSVAGTISGAVLDGVEVFLLDLVRDASTSTTTDAGGGYTLTGLRDGSYMVVPVLAGYAFDPASRTFTVTAADVAAQDFTSAVQP